MSETGCKEKQAAGFASAVYVHVPFCRRKCRYCDFYSVAADEAAAGRYVSAAVAQLGRVRDRLEPPLRSVYVGGGTPTSLPAGILHRLLNALGECIDADTEFTVEANPLTVTRDLAGRLADCGVNRVSIGAQSFEPGELRLLGRLHTPEDIPRSVEALRGAGLDNINLDLIYGIPAQTGESWSHTLRRALELGPEHLSCYALSFPAGTPIEADLRHGRVTAVDDSTQRHFYESARSSAARAGLAQYELSNFARDDRRCIHNITYWENMPYVGIGPAASGYIDGVRRTAAADVDAYVDAGLGGLEPPGESEQLTGSRRAAEALMLGLRMIRGVGRRGFKYRYDVDPVDAFARTVSRYAADGYLLVEPDRLRLAADAYFVADTILSDLLNET